MRALRHPALGLALVMVGLSHLPTQMMQVANIWLYDTDVPLRLVLPMLMTATVTIFQVATGVAITRQRFAGVCFAGWLLAACVLTGVTAMVSRGEESFGAGLVLGAAFETLGLPVLIAIVSMRYEHQLEDTRAFGDLSAALFVIAVHTFVMVPLGVASTIRMVQGSHVDISSWATLLAWPIAMLVVGVFAALGARSPAVARVYIYLSVAIALVFTVLEIGSTLFQDAHEMVRRIVITSRVLGLVGLVLPVTFLLYLRSLTAERAASRLPMWIALTYVPTLLARVFLSKELSEQFGHAPTASVIAIAVGFAVVLLALGDATLRDLPAARGWGIAAAVLAFTLLTIGVVYAFGTDVDRPMARTMSFGLLAPLGYLIASTSGAAFYSRR